MEPASAKATVLTFCRALKWKESLNAVNCCEQYGLNICASFTWKVNPETQICTVSQKCRDAWPAWRGAFSQRATAGTLQVLFRAFLLEVEWRHLSQPACEWHENGRWSWNSRCYSSRPWSSANDSVPPTPRLQVCSKTNWVGQSAVVGELVLPTVLPRP